MPLDDQDLATVRALVEQERTRERKDAWVRRLGMLALLMLLSVGSMAITASWFRGTVQRLEGVIASQNREVAEVRSEYAKLLAQNEELRKSRAEAERRSGFDPSRTPAQQTSLNVAQVLDLLNQSSRIQQSAAKLDPNDDAQLEKMLADYQSLLGGVQDVTTRMLLNETDPRRVAVPAGPLANDAAVRSATAPALIGPPQPR